MIYSQIAQSAGKKLIFFDIVNTTPYSKKLDDCLCLLNQISNNNSLSLWQLIPKKFIISTNTGSCNFNTDMLATASPMIKEFHQNNPTSLQYHLDINDSTNILQKFELLFQGKTIDISKDEYPIFLQIIEMLNLQDCFNIIKNPFNDTNHSKKKYYLNIVLFKYYLKLEDHKIFKIKTNKKTYICNKIGIFSSSVLADLITKDPNLDYYEYDYDDDDEMDNFQIICDFFNLEKISISQKSANYIKEIAEDLKINYIIEYVDKIITKKDQVLDIIDDSQTISESVDNLFNWLYNIKTKTVKTVFNSIILSEWIKTTEDVQELAAFFLQVIKTYSTVLHPYLVDLLEQLNKISEEKEYDNLKILMPLIIKKLMDLFGENNSICSFVYILHKKGFIKLEEIVEKIKKTTINYQNIAKSEFIYSWFLPELIDNGLYQESIVNEYNNPVNFSMFRNPRIKDQRKPKEKKSNLSTFIDYYYPERIEIYKKMRDEREPDDEITKALRHDDVDTLQSILSRNENDFSESAVPFNIFDNFASNGKIKYINYAAAYGSIKCFKYLLLNHQKINKNTFQFAIFGGNDEIIKIVDQANLDEFSNADDDDGNYIYSEINEYLDNKGILVAIIQHKNNIFDWIFDNKLNKNDKDTKKILKLIQESAQNGNIHALIAAIDTEFDILEDYFNVQLAIQLASKNGFFKYSQFLSEIIDKKKNSMIKPSKFSTNPIGLYTKKDRFSSFNYISKQKKIEEDKFDLTSFVSFGNLNIFKIGEIFASNLESYLNKSLPLAVLNDYPTIIKYILSKETENKQLISDFNQIDAICNSLTLKSLDIFDYLMKKFQIYERVDTILVQNYFFILNSAASNNKMEVLKKIIDIILNKSQNEDFTTPFIKSIQNGSIEMCRYFVDKKLKLDYDKIASDINNYNDQYKFFDIKIFSLIYENVKNYKLKEKLNRSAIYLAIKQEDVALTDYLLSKNISYDNILFDAVTKNVDIVKTVLKYKNNPSFINRKTYEGTALCKAVKNYNIPVIEFLLSVPEIDINVFDNINSHQNNMLEIVKLFMKNDKFNINTILNYKGDSVLHLAILFDDTEFADLILKNSKTDINMRNYEEKTPLILASQKNYISIIDYILNDKRFDADESRLYYAFYNSNGEVLTHLASSKYFDANSFISIENTFITNIFPRNSPKSPGIYDNILIHAMQKHDLNMVNIIINHPSFDIEKSNNKSAIFKSIEILDNVDIFKKLIEIKGVDINSFKYNDKRIFQYALCLKKFEIMTAILDNPKFVPEKEDIPMAFISLIKNYNDKNYSRIQKLVEYAKSHENTFDFNKPLPNQKSLFTSLQLQLQINKNIVNLFLENGADPNIPDGNGVYPLECAISMRSLEFVQALLDSNKVDYTKKVPIVQYSVKSNDELKIVDEYFSLEKTEPKEIKKTIQNYKPINLNNDKNYCSYLHLAAKCINSDILKEFLDRKLIDVNKKDSDGNTPLITACKCNIKNNILLLFEVDGIDYQHRNNLGKDAIDTISDICVKKSINKKEINNKDECCQLIIELLKSKNKETDAPNIVDSIFHSFKRKKINTNGYEYKMEKFKQNKKKNDDPDPLKNVGIKSISKLNQNNNKPTSTFNSTDFNSKPQQANDFSKDAFKLALAGISNNDSSKPNTFANNNEKINHQMSSKKKFGSIKNAKNDQTLITEKKMENEKKPEENELNEEEETKKEIEENEDKKEIKIIKQSDEVTEKDLEKNTFQLREEEHEKIFKQQKEKEKELQMVEQQMNEKQKLFEMKMHQIKEKEKELEMKEQQLNEKHLREIERFHDNGYENLYQYQEDENPIFPYEMQMNQMIQQQWQTIMQAEYIRQANFENQMRMQAQFLQNLQNKTSKKKSKKKKISK